MLQFFKVEIMCCLIFVLEFKFFDIKYTVFLICCVSHLFIKYVEKV